MTKCEACDEILFPDGHYLKCGGCGMMIIREMPERTPDAYPARYYGAQGRKFARPVEAVRSFFLGVRTGMAAQASGDRSLLDIGCGNGAFPAFFACRGYRVAGIELPGPALEAARRERGIDVRAADTVTPETFARGDFGVVTLWHVLEHLDDPRETLLRCRRWLRDDGFLFLEVPNLDSFQARVFGARWFHLDFPRHRSHFTPVSLRLLLAKAGFKPVREEYFSFDMGAFGIVQSLLNLLIRPRNHFYDALHKGRNRGMKFVASALLAAALFPAAAAAAAVESMMKKGAVIRCVCVPA